MEIDLGKLRHNTRLVAGWCREAGLLLLGVTKGVTGDPRVARVFLEGGASGLADSRLANFERLSDLRNGFPRSPFLLLRPPVPGAAARTTALTDAVLCSSIDTAEALARAAASGRSYDILLTVDVGDLREGLSPEEATRAAVAMDRRLAAASGTPDPARRARVAGLATNMACFSGIVPTRGHLELMARLGREMAEALGRSMWVSAGNTAVLPLLRREGVPPGLSDLRVGEGLLLGRESLHREPLPGGELDAFVLRAAVIEIGRKPTSPIGECAENAFGHRPLFVDRGPRWRAILAVGRQDVVPEGLTPRDPGIEVVGGTSDHLVVDIEDHPGHLAVGDELGFSVNYACLLQAMTSTDVARAYVGESQSR